MQKTLRSDVTFHGVGLHDGQDVVMTVRPAAVETGIWFRRTDIKVGDNFVAANWQFAVHSALCTRLVNADGVSVATVEHIMAALSGCGISNAIVDISGAEVPIMDGSSVEFVKRFLSVGLVEQSAPVRAMKILQTVEVSENGAHAALYPATGMEMEFAIDFPDAAIGAQSKSMNLANGAFVHELCNSRTFCRNSDVDTMRANGLALGGTLLNAVVVDGAEVLSPGGMRHVDEPVRHKMLDAMGDLALAGGPIIGRYVGKRAGHT
ncbi:MAG: UDP-3-O-acyl-N-acetylglucosamine deacetylase, partial [Planktomarina sp.]